MSLDMDFVEESMYFESQLSKGEIWRVLPIYLKSKERNFKND